MNEERLVDDMRTKLKGGGYRSRTVSLSHVRDLQQGIEGSSVRGLLDEQFYQEELTGFSFEHPDVPRRVRSLVVVAAPQPQIRIVFTIRGEPQPVMIPPTYVHGTDKRVEEILASVLNPAGYRIARATLPLKLLAVRSGLGDYGRNNICYVRGIGSFHRLVAFWSDIPCLEDSWREPTMMERCGDCRACLHSCPTEAITPDRFVVHAERCITFHNERDQKFPAWIDPSWHNCLVGCLRCQEVCPENIPFLDWVENDLVFSEEETSLILESTGRDRIPSETAKKLERVGMLEYSDILGRNLRVLLARKEKPT